MIHEDGDIPDGNDEGTNAANISTDESLLSMYSAAALLTADCMGTGILALPGNMKTLTPFWGYLFLIINLPINLYAGTILSNIALALEEEEQDKEIKSGESELTLVPIQQLQEQPETSPLTNKRNRSFPFNKRKNESDYQSVFYDQEIDSNTHELTETISDNNVNCSNDEVSEKSLRDKTGLVPINSQPQDDKEETVFEVNPITSSKIDQNHQHRRSTRDFIGMANILFATKNYVKVWIRVTYYTNLFLVLGDYILVMSHAVVAMMENGHNRICIPQAGLMASTLMFTLSQIRTMSHLGRGVTITSLMALFGVVATCLYYHNSPDYSNNAIIEANETDNESIMRKFTALSSIGFAVGSQKLLLNIRHEMHPKEHAPFTLAIALAIFGSMYLLTCILGGGSNVPSFLFDAIPKGTIERRVAGFLLWVHVSVSYAINSQAFCSSIMAGESKGRLHWALVTFCISCSSYLVSNAIPFFKDLVAITGALTSVPLTLLLPGLFYRQYYHNNNGLHHLQFSKHAASYLLLIYSVLFLTFGLFGSVYSIGLDWKNHGAPFSCT